MASVPVVLLAIGGYLWLSGGRYAETDNAYVQQSKIVVTPQVSGRIVEAPVRENDTVAAGAMLFRIDPAPYQIALDSADAALASARLQVEELRAAYQQAVAATKAAEDDVAFLQKALDRQSGLLDKGVATQAAYDSAENALHSAQQSLAQANQRVLSALSALGGDATIPTDNHPAVLAAMAQRDQAALNLANTTVTAPEAGVVAQADRLLVGQQVSPATSVLTLVETGDAWVEANFKETDLNRMVPGQTATISVDAYPGHECAAEVASIGAGTGSEFSVLPAQNATGNWVKVVQRVPVHIRFTELPDGLSMRTGLSANVSVDLNSTPATGTAASTATPVAAAPSS
jgi:membrane fusion protein (multidrug efflux system)